MPHDQEPRRSGKSARGRETFEDGYREGWLSVAGDAPLPVNPTQPPPDEPRDYIHGFFYGRADALERFEPHA